MNDTGLFEDYLEMLDFELVKHDDGYGVIDKQGGNLGGIENERFANCIELVDKLDIYTNDCVVYPIEKELESYGYYDYPQNDWGGLMNFCWEKLDDKRLRYMRWELDILDLICDYSRVAKINLDDLSHGKIIKEVENCNERV